MSLPSRLTAHLLNPLFGTAYLSGITFQELPAGLELVSSHGVIPTGSPPVAEKLPVWEANARVVLAGAKRWAQLRWGGL